MISCFLEVYLDLFISHICFIFNDDYKTIFKKAKNYELSIQQIIYIIFFYYLFIKKAKQSLGAIENKLSCMKISEISDIMSTINLEIDNYNKVSINNKMYEK